MSYCRFSIDDYRCDLYIYEAPYGFVTHVAGNKCRGYIPRTLPMPPYPRAEVPGWWQRLQFSVWTRLWLWSHQLQHWYLDHAPRRPLGLPFAGETFTDPDASACAERVRELVALGYRVPAGVIVALEAEAV